MSKPGGTGDDGVRLSGLLEVGGEVTRLISPGQGARSKTPSGTLEGLVWDSTSNAPLEGATVFLSGTQYSAGTDADGAFILLDLPEGTFSVAFTHPRLDSLGTFSEAVEVRIVAGQISGVTLKIPPDAGGRVSGCTEDQLAVRSGVVTGVVRDAATRNLLEGASVSVTWSEFEKRGVDTFTERRRGLQTLSDTSGRYSLCGVPQDATLTLRAEHGGAHTEAARVNQNPDGYTVVHLEIGKLAF
jgi:hypothetical protein